LGLVEERGNDSGKTTRAYRLICGRVVERHVAKAALNLCCERFDLPRAGHCHRPSVHVEGFANVHEYA
jgi:hypothetical protein